MNRQQFNDWLKDNDACPDAVKWCNEHPEVAYRAALPVLMREDDEDKYRALGQLICVWDALIEAEKEEIK